jgi:hypothetical protein
MGFAVVNSPEAIDHLTYLSQSEQTAVLDHIDISAIAAAD